MTATRNSRSEGPPECPPPSFRRLILALAYRVQKQEIDSAISRVHWRSGWYVLGQEATCV